MTPPPPPGAQLLAQQPAEVQTAIKEHEQHGKWLVYRTAEYTLYPYNQEPEPTVDCAPLRTTDIQLQPGETITDGCAGDTERWMATPAASGDPRNAIPHLAVKPQVPGIETNLTIYTTKHIYHLLLGRGATQCRRWRLITRRADRGDESCRRSRRERQAGSGRSAG